MQEAVLAERSGRVPRVPLLTVRAMLRGHWRQAEGYQKLGYVVGALLIASAVFHAGVLIVTGGSLEGPVSWRKPILFGEAFGLTLVSVAWVMTFLPRRRLIGWILMAALALANSEEVFWVSLQQWRGVPSHFNLGTPFDARMFLTAGFVILVTGAVIAAVTVWTFVSLRAPLSLGLAIRAGMLFLVLSQVVGLLMINNGNARVTDPATGAFLGENVASASVFGSAGLMKIPHALALHGIQALALLGLLLGLSRWTEPRRALVVLAGIAGYGGLVGVSLWQAFHGLAPLDLSPGVGSVLAAGVVLILVSYAVATVSIQRTPS